MKITEKIKERRLELRFSQWDVAVKLGISQNAYSKIEMGRTVMTVPRLQQISDMFEVGIKYWF